MKVSVGSGEYYQPKKPFISMNMFECPNGHSGKYICEKIFSNGFPSMESYCLICEGIIDGKD